MSEPDEKGWRDISTAPKDGRRVLLWHPKWSAPNAGQFYGVNDWGIDYTLGAFTYQPTHWMPLPAPPLGDAL